MDSQSSTKSRGSLIRLLLLTAAIGIGSASCATHEQAGTVAGAGLGAAAGHALTDSPVGALIGAVIGAAIGADIGRQLDEADRRRTAYALEYYQTGDTYQWVNPDSRREYACTPTRTYEGARGPCRDFILLTSENGEPVEIRGQACREPDGTWRTIK